MTEPEDPTSASGDRPPASPANTPPPHMSPPEDSRAGDADQGGEAADPPVPDPPAADTIGAAPDPAIPTPDPVAPAAEERPPPDPPAPPRPPEERAPVIPPTPPAPPVEPVVPPAPQVHADAPAAPPPSVAAAKPAPVDYEEPDGADDEDEDDLEPIPRWVSLVNTIGVGLVGVVTAEVISAIVQGFTYKADDLGVSSDLLHRLGAPFGENTWIVALVGLLLGVLLMSLPVLLDEDTTFGQERMALLALGVTVAVAIIICLGSILAVRSNLHGLTAQSRDVPGYYRVYLTTFLLGTLGTGVLAIYGAVVARSLRSGRD